MFVYILAIGACFITSSIVIVIQRFQISCEGVILHQGLHSLFVDTRRELLPIVFGLNVGSAMACGRSGGLLLLTILDPTKTPSTSSCISNDTSARVAKISSFNVQVTDG